MQFQAEAASQVLHTFRLTAARDILEQATGSLAGRDACSQRKLGSQISPGPRRQFTQCTLGRHHHQAVLHLRVIAGHQTKCQRRGCRLWNEHQQGANVQFPPAVSAMLQPDQAEREDFLRAGTLGRGNCAHTLAAHAQQRAGKSRRESVLQIRRGTQALNAPVRVNPFTPSAKLLPRHAAVRLLFELRGRVRLQVNQAQRAPPPRKTLGINFHAVSRPFANAAQAPPQGTGLTPTFQQKALAIQLQRVLSRRQG